MTTYTAELIRELGNGSWIVRYSGENMKTLVRITAVEYVSDLLPVNKTSKIDQLLSIGGSEWTDYGYHRIYINNLCELYGLDYTTYKTGNIQSATLNGKSLSNGKASGLRGHLGYAKMWYDVKTEKYMTKDLHDDYRDQIIETLENRMIAN